MKAFVEASAEGRKSWEEGRGGRGCGLFSAFGEVGVWGVAGTGEVEGVC